jgi:hypothetical protein
VSHESSVFPSAKACYNRFEQSRPDPGLLQPRQHGELAEVVDLGSSVPSRPVLASCISKRPTTEPPIRCAGAFFASCVDAA